MNFYECCDLTKKVYLKEVFIYVLVFVIWMRYLFVWRFTHYWRHVRVFSAPFVDKFKKLGRRQLLKIYVDMYWTCCLHYNIAIAVFFLKKNVISKFKAGKSGTSDLSNAATVWRSLRSPCINKMFSGGSQQLVFGWELVSLLKGSAIFIEEKTKIYTKYKLKLRYLSKINFLLRSSSLLLNVVLGK